MTDEKFTDIDGAILTSILWHRTHRAVTLGFEFHIHYRTATVNL